MAQHHARFSIHAGLLDHPPLAKEYTFPNIFQPYPPMQRYFNTRRNKPYNEPLKWKGREREKKRRKIFEKKYFHIEAYPSIQTELTRHAQFRDEYWPD